VNNHSVDVFKVGAKGTCSQKRLVGVQRRKERSGKAASDGQVGGIEDQVKQFRGSCNKGRTLKRGVVIKETNDKDNRLKGICCEE